MPKFTKNVKKSGTKRTFAFAEYGYIPDGDPVSDVYLARVTSIRNKVSVVGLLQEDILMRVESRWDPFIPVAMLAKGNMLMQMMTEAGGGGPKSLVTKAASRRLWVGTTPMTLSLKLKFEAINDSYKDVVEPCRILQSLALPSEPTAGVSKDTETAVNKLKSDQTLGNVWNVVKTLPFLSPPGPSPFSWEGILSSRKPINELNISSIIEGTKGGDRIMLQLGKFLRFDDVIIKEVSTAFHIKMDESGDPVSSDISIIFETYEIPTVQSLAQAYTKTSMFQESVEEDGRREFHITGFK